MGGSIGAIRDTQVARVYQALTRDLARAKKRLKSQFLRRGIPCGGASSYDPRRRKGWLEQLPAAMRPMLRLIGEELDGLAVGREGARTY